jgi:hypothetical protein
MNCLKIEEAMPDCAAAVWQPQGRRGKKPLGEEKTSGAGALANIIYNVAAYKQF